MKLFPYFSIFPRTDQTAQQIKEISVKGYQPVGYTAGADRGNVAQGSIPGLVTPHGDPALLIISIKLSSTRPFLITALSACLDSTSKGFVIVEAHAKSYGKVLLKTHSG